MAKQALPAPGVLEALAEARAILFCPSNPVVSIGPILAVPGVQEAIVESSAPVVAISPIVLDQRDADQRDDVERLGSRGAGEETLMRTPKIAEALARAALESAFAA